MSIGRKKPEPSEIKKIIMMAERGDAGAQYELGGLYKEYLYNWSKDDIISNDVVKAITWYRKAAEQGHKSAQRELGKMYQNGNGIQRSYAEAVRWYHKAAIQGDAVAQNSLGLMFQNGHGVSQNNSEAVKWYRKSAEQGNVDAQSNLREIQQNDDTGDGQSRYEFVSVDDGDVPPDDVEDVSRCRKAAEQGNADAQYRLGNMFFTGKGVDEDNEEAIKWYRKAAGQGQADAQYQLGEIYYWGQCVDEDYHEAAKWYREAAEQGNAEAQNKLDLMYEEGKISPDDDFEDYQDDISDDVPPDDVEDVSRYRKAAEKGDATAQFNLGVRYAQGEGVPQDYTEALKWYRKSAEQGNADAYNNIGVMYYNGTSVPQDDIEALKCFRRAAELGDANGQNNVGLMYEYGKGVPQSDYEAARWYHKSAEQGFAVALNSLTRMGDKGNADAQNNLGWMYRNGKGVSQDDTEAAKWRRKAAEQGNANAQNSLGWMYQNGKGVPQDDAEAVKWWLKAAEQGNADAQYNLGCWVYLNGKGVPQSDAEAMKWYRKAAEKGHANAQKNLDQMKAKGAKVDKDESESVSEQRTTKTTADSKKGKSRTVGDRLHDNKECKALLDACTPKLYQQNVFRISGIHIDASPRDFKRRFEDLRFAAEMNDLGDELNHAFALNPMPNIDQIREAAQRIQDPEKRIIDEFFWFWPLDWCKSENDSALDALRHCDPDKAQKIWSDALSDNNAPQCTIAKHNLAVFHHLKAIDSEIKALDHDLSAEALNAISKDWRTCFKWWEDLVDDDELWSLIADRIRTIDDPRLTTGFTRRLCATLPEAMDKINAMLAIDFAEKGKLSQATNHIIYMKETHQGKDDVSKTLSIITKPLKTRVDSAVEIAISIAKKEPAQAAQAALVLLQSVSEPLKVIQTVLPPKDHERIDLCDQVAEACLTCQIAYAGETEDWKTCLEILDNALKYAVSKEAKEHLADERSKVVINKYLSPIYDFCKTVAENVEKNPYSAAEEAQHVISEAPHLILKLSSANVPDEIVLRGKDQIALSLDFCAVSYGNKTDKWKPSVKILEEALKYATSQEVKSRIEKNLSIVKKNEKMENLSPISSAPSLSTFYGIGFRLYGSTDTDQETGSYLSTYYFTILFIPVFPICRYRVIAINNGYRFFGKEHLRTFDKWHLGISLILMAIFIFSFMSQNNSGTTYQETPSSQSPSVSSPVPSYDNTSTQSALAVEIENGKTQVNQLETQIKDIDGRLDDYKQRMKSYQDSNMIEEYNNLIPSFNSLVRERKKLYREYSNLLDEVNEKIRRHNLQNK
jgi:hypothetical protein